LVPLLKVIGSNEYTKRKRRRKQSSISFIIMKGAGENTEDAREYSEAP
jgi:hypothetical protein